MNTCDNHAGTLRGGPRVIIACRVMQPEIDALVGGRSGIDVHYLEQRLHDTPRRMPGLIQEQIDAVQSFAAQIVLGYGLCSNGIVGLKAPPQGLIIPRAHDCISFFLGSHEAYEKHFHDKPGTFFLTPGWVAEGKDPLTYMRTTYVPRMGEQMAVWGVKEAFKNYTHITLIDNGLDDMTALRRIARENARFLDKQYEEIRTRPDFFRQIVFGPYPLEAFIHLKGGQTVAQEMILQ